MIAKIGSGKSTTGLIRYLFDTKKAKDHTDPHLVASWDGFAPDPGRADDFDATKKRLVADLDLRVKQARRLGRAPDRHVWHCSVRAAPGDRHLTDAEWADIARRIVAATGIAPQGDLDGCRWVAVRHADDHIHIAATKVRGDLRTARHWNDYLTADKELAAIEKEYGLQRVVRGDRTAAKRPTRAETEKARRAGTTRTSRERLRTTVRQLVSIASSMEEFLHLLGGVEGVLVDVQRFPSGDVRGYKVAVEGDTNAAGEPVWFSGAKLAPDLSYPKIRERLTATGIAGVFTVLDDLAAFLRYMLDGSTSRTSAGFTTAWTACSLTIQTGGLQPARGLFWHPAPGTSVEEDVWVHYGFTGTGMWISPARGRWAVLLTNKLYYTRDRAPLTDVRNAFRALAFM
ncbi:relaxase/mobilization nuclease domain-containing protein [Streptomyces griseoluteus]|uniref:relaxase/mobilization nuclease domain-containing protein n=1 Tax=Streptomyces griseoluteus TaxID=29306 RepID=UPI00142F0243|nr:serine hydrolase [Streptomyces griseoluteus]GHF17451.1 hypothetical protein GCM10017776_38960 [Streptomyces griseoluteus]